MVSPAGPRALAHLALTARLRAQLDQLRVNAERQGTIEEIERHRHTVNTKPATPPHAPPPKSATPAPDTQIPYPVDRPTTPAAGSGAWMPDPVEHRGRRRLPLLQVTATSATGVTRADLVDATLAKVSLQQNSDMRTITAWAAVIAMPTMVVGVYGVNFDHMPKLHWKYGYPPSSQ